MITLPAKTEVIRAIVDRLAAVVISTGEQFTSDEFQVTNAMIVRPILAKEVKRFNSTNAVRAENSVVIGISMSKTARGSYVLVASDYNQDAIDTMVESLVAGGIHGETALPILYNSLDEDTAGELSVAPNQTFMELEASPDHIIAAMYIHELCDSVMYNQYQVGQILGKLYGSALEMRTMISPERTDGLGTYEFYAVEKEGKWIIQYDLRSTIDEYKSIGHPAEEVSTIVAQIKAG